MHVIIILTTATTVFGHRGQHQPWVYLAKALPVPIQIQWVRTGKSDRNYNLGTNIHKGTDCVGVSIGLIKSLGVHET